MGRYSMSRQKEYYVFRRANAMSNHNFTGDVALVKAISKSQAIRKFSRYYADVQDSEVFKLVGSSTNTGDVMILTDY